MSKIRLLKSTTNYPEYISAFVKKNPPSEVDSFEELQKKYFYDAYGWSDYWKRYLEKTGRYECMEIVQNAAFLQKKWAWENGLKYNDEKPEEVLMAQIEYFRPDIVFLVDLYTQPDLAKKIKENFSFIKMIIGWDGIVWNQISTYEYVDMVVTCVPSSADYYAKHGKKNWYFRYAFDPEILQRISNNDKIRNNKNIFFSGSLVTGSRYHQSRMDFLYGIAKRFDVEYHLLHVPKNFNWLQPYYLKQGVLKGKLSYYRKLSYLSKINQSPLFGLEMFNAMQQAGIVLNMHGDNSPEYAANMRMFEATGVGALLITDHKKNIGEFFEPEKEIFTYSDTYDALRLLKKLLNDPQKVQSVAKAGQERVLRDHTYEKRMIEFDEILNRYV